MDALGRRPFDRHQPDSMHELNEQIAGANSRPTAVSASASP